MERHSRKVRRIWRDCDDILREVDGLIDKHRSLGTSKKKGWDRLQFGTKDLGPIRSDIAACTNAINVYIGIVALSSLGRVEQKTHINGDQLLKIREMIDSLAAEYRTGKREGSILTTYSNDHKETWKTFRRSLLSSGFTSDRLTQYGPEIKAYLMQLAKNGKLDEEAYDSDRIQGEACNSLPLHHAADKDCGLDTGPSAHSLKSDSPLDSTIDSFVRLAPEPIPVLTEATSNENLESPSVGGITRLGSPRPQPIRPQPIAKSATEPEYHPSEVIPGETPGRPPRIPRAGSSCESIPSAMKQKITKGKKPALRESTRKEKSSENVENHAGGRERVILGEEGTEEERLDIEMMKLELRAEADEKEIQSLISIARPRLERERAENMTPIYERLMECLEGLLQSIKSNVPRRYLPEGKVEVVEKLRAEVRAQKETPAMEALGRLRQLIESDWSRIDSPEGKIDLEFVEKLRAKESTPPFEMDTDELLREMFELSAVILLQEKVPVAKETTREMAWEMAKKRIIRWQSLYREIELKSASKGIQIEPLSFHV
ncbi:hypothetical protein MMC07_002812 [Pseudocyphellaria aurata]|nr:hypothetical protein [Pseudocyphellaria aurata]